MPSDDEGRTEGTGHGEGTDDAGLPELTDGDRLAARLGQGHERLASGDPEGAYELLDEALTLARDLDDTAAEASACGLLAQVCLRLGEQDEAGRHAAAALHLARVRGDGAAASHFQRLLATARSSPEAAEMSTAFGDGRAALESGEAGRAMPLLERARELAVELGHGVAEAASMHLLARAHLDLGRGDEAAPLARRALEMAEEQGDEQACELCRQLVARIDEDAGAPREGLAADLARGRSALAAGDIEGGIEILEGVREQARREEEPIPEASACGMLAQAYLERERPDDAARRATRAAEIAEALGEPEAAAEMRLLADMAGASAETHELARRLHEAAIALDAGRHEESTASLERALAIASQAGNDVAEALASGLLARALAALGRRDEAAAHARRARGIAAARGEAASVAHFDALLAEIEGDGAES